jgi:hypothetical protein
MILYIKLFLYQNNWILISTHVAIVIFRHTLLISEKLR